MALYDRVWFTTATTGTGTITVGSALSGYRTPAGASVPNAGTFQYTIVDGSAWEVGTGTYATSGTTVARSLISSSTGALLNLSGSATMFITAAASTFGSAAFQNTGTSGANVPLLNGANTWSAAQLHTAAFGYGTGAGGTVTQLTSKSTSVTLNKPCGKITTHNASLGANTSVTFLFNNSELSVDDVLVIMVGSGTNGAYAVDVGSTASGIAAVTLRNTTGGALAEAVELHFFVMKIALS